MYRNSEYRRKQAKRNKRIENGLIGGIGCAIVLYLIGFLAFWSGVIYLIWHFTLSH